LKPQNGKRTTPPVAPCVGRGLARIAAWFDALRASRPRPGLRAPPRPRLKAREPGWLSSFFAARMALRAGIPARDFLQHRLTQHLASLPVASARLPMSFSIDEDGAIACRPAESPPARAPWLDSFLRAEGSAALGPEIQLGQADVARLAARIEAQRRRVDEMNRELEETARATELADPDDDAQAARMGRPPVPLPLGLMLQLFALALLVAETWQLAVPCLEASGIRTRDLAGELHRNPAGVVLGSVFALGASVSLFVLAHLALRRCLDLFEGQAEASRRMWRAAVSLGASSLAAAVTWSIAGVRPGAQRAADAGATRLALFLVALAIPITTAWLLRLARRQQERREEALALARTWDQEHYRTLVAVTRRAAALAEEEKRLAGLEAERAGALRRLRTLQQRVAAVERLGADAREAEAEDLAGLAQSIGASLELDRYEYLRQAAARGVTVQRPKVPAPMPTPVRETVGEGERNLGLAG
jgi:hypothetical protein